MRRAYNFKLAIAITGCVAAVAPTAVAFEGRIKAVVSLGTETTPLLYTVGTNFLRIEVTATNWPHPVDIVELNSGTLTLLFPHNRSFVRLKPEVRSPAFTRSGPPEGGTPNQIPPGIAPQSRPGAPVAGVPAMPMMPMPMEKIELKATGQKTNFLGFACERFEIKQRGETLEIWATDQLLPYQPYVRNQPHRRFGPRGIEEQWPGLLTSRKLFPLRATLRFDEGAEGFRFEVKTVTPEKLTDADAKLFAPPSGYYEIEPLPF